MANTIIVPRVFGGTIFIVVGASTASTAITAMGRDGKVAGMGRDGKQSVIGRDGQIIGKGR